MTVVASWVREINKKKNIYELIMISDSRLNSGMYWDECPKIMRFERDDCILGFAGNTMFSYPLMLQMNNLVTEYAKLSKGAISFCDLAGHFIRTLNSMTHKIDNQIRGNVEVEIEPYTNEYIFAGYDWKKQKYEIYTISCVPHQPGEVKRCGEGGGLIVNFGNGKKEITYDETEYYYSYDRNTRKLTSSYGRIKYDDFDNHFGTLGVIGDMRGEYLRVLRQILHEKYGDNYELAIDSKFDMEPYEALCRLLERESKVKNSTVGGAPQMVKVYQYMKSGTIGVYWPEMINGSPYENRTLLGRKLLSYEETDYWFWDNKSGRSYPCRDGMNEYVDMFEGISLRFTENDTGSISVQFIKGSDPYFERCSFRIKSNESRLTYNSSFKVMLDFQKENNVTHIYPTYTIKEFWVPAKSAFVNGEYVTRGSQIDMFECVGFQYVSVGKNCFTPIIRKKKRDYSELCEFNVISSKELKYDDTFYVELKYNVEDSKQSGTQPIVFYKKYKIPSRYEMNNLNYRNKLIQKFLKAISNK